MDREKLEKYAFATCPKCGFPLSYEDYLDVFWVDKYCTTCPKCKNNVGAWIWCTNNKKFDMSECNNCKVRFECYTE